MNPMVPTTRRHALATFGALVAGATLAFSSPASASTTWPTYHATPDRLGADTSELSLSPSTQAWRATLDGAVYGQPVVANGLIYVATENNTVYALSAHDGSVVWEHNVGTPLHGVGAAAGCGDIDPLGITSTPVIDPLSGTLYVVAEIASGSGQGAVVHHQLIGLNPSTGAVGVSTSAEPPIGSALPAGQSTVWLQQRGALAVANGRVYVTYGGLAGDCGIYHGWVVGVDENAARPSVSYDVTPNGQGGAIWGPSGAAIDGGGNIYVATGNPNNPQNPPVDDSESAVKLDPSLNRLAAYRDTLATNDADLATNGITVLPGGLVFAVGKTDVGYLLASSNLAPVAAIAGVCGGDPDGGNAYDASTNTLYVPCRNGTIQPVNLTTHAVKPAIGGVNGPPILVNGDLWAVSYPGSSLFDIAPATGTKVQTLSTGSPVTTFASPSAADGLVLIGTSTGVTAFAGPGGPPTGGTDPVTAYYNQLGGGTSYLGGPRDNVHPLAGGEAEDFVGGSIYWSPGTGAHAVRGAILAHYQALGGPAGFLGFPLNDETATPDTFGRYNHFSNDGSIYWTPVTGAWSVHGAIQDHWAALRWEAGPLGYPITDENGTPDGIGRYNHFSNVGSIDTGSIYWTPATGAWSVRGAIEAHWAALRWEAGPLGYPVTDENGTPDGVGRYNHFSNNGSIYWTPATGAWSVHGAIYGLWAFAALGGGSPRLSDQ